VARADAAAVVLAAGSGRRMGVPVNKVRLELAGRSILARSLDVFESHPLIDRIVLVGAPGEVHELRAAAAGFEKLAAVVPGGSTRHRSEYGGLRALEPAVRAGDLKVLLVHDAARPFVTPGEIDSLVAEARRTGAAILAARVEATGLVLVDDGGRWHTPPGGLWAALTPQAFRAGLILDAHHRAAREGFEGTDTASVAEHAGLTVRTVEGSRANVKITTPADLAVAERLLPIWERDPVRAAERIAHL
jgi:2-C-methyl-D-erythritol 4-phosphate cytidylyltransferase